ncbi:MAG: hypothetical protein R2708_28190 [Vicinamibacterales bacterium]
MLRPVRLLVCLLVVAAGARAEAQVSSPARSPWRAADGVTVDEVGDPQYSTFSLCAIDPATGQSGAAVTTRVPFCRAGRALGAAMARSAPWNRPPPWSSAACAGWT